MTMKYLEFDSHILKYDVYQLQTNSEQEIDNALNLENNKKQQICVISETPLDDNFVQFYDGRLGSENIIYTLNNPSYKEPKKRCSKYTLSYPTQNLYNLSIIAGSHSRFNNDDMITKEQYQQIFKHWIDNDTKDSSTIIFTYQNKGFISLNTNSSNAQISLLAVHEKYRGQNVGSALIQSALQECHRRGLRHVSVGTQTTNHPAKKLYEKWGFCAQKSKYIYHFWNNF